MIARRIRVWAAAIFVAMIGLACVAFGLARDGWADETAQRDAVMPVAKIKVYFPDPGSVTDYLEGKLWLSTTSARYAKRHGRMKLKFDGTVAADQFYEVAGATVYRVTNADEYLALNKGAKGFCPRPIRWLAIQNMALLGNDSMFAIRVGQILVADWHEIRMDRVDICSWGVYSTAMEKNKGVDTSPDQRVSPSLPKISNPERVAMLMNEPVPPELFGVWGERGNCSSLSKRLVITAHTVKFGKHLPDAVFFATDDGPGGEDAIHWIEEGVTSNLAYDRDRDRFDTMDMGWGYPPTSFYARCPK